MSSSFGISMTRNYLITQFNASILLQLSYFWPITVGKVQFSRTVSRTWGALSSLVRGARRANRIAQVHSLKARTDAASRRRLLGFTRFCARCFLHARVREAADSPTRLPPRFPPRFPRNPPCGGGYSTTCSPAENLKEGGLVAGRGPGGLPVDSEWTPEKGLAVYTEFTPEKAPRC